MSARPLPSWPEANQRYLMAAMAQVREALDRHSGPDAAPAEGATAAALEAAEAELPAPAALQTLCARLGLTRFERDVLLLCAAVELDATMAARCASAQGDPRRVWPSFGLALAALAEPHWSAVTPAAPLRRFRLIEIASGEGLTSGALHVEERVLHYLCGIDGLDERLVGIVERVEVDEPPPAHRAVSEQMARLWSQRPPQGSQWPVVQLCGSDAAARRSVAAAGCARVGLALHAVRAADLPSTAAERESFASLWRRESLLGVTALLVEIDDEDAAPTAAALALVEHLPGVVVASSHEPLRSRRRLSLRLDVPRLAGGEQKDLWIKALGPLAEDLEPQLAHVTSQFSLGPMAILATGARLSPDLAAKSGGLKEALWQACRAQARPRLDDLAQRIDAAPSWADLVLPPEEKQILREIAAHVRQRARVYEEWGFAQKSTRGLGISALFAGASGTGKTMAAEVLAGELSLDLYRIDLSQVVSKYIGETEKNLRRIFDAAEAGGAILLFDEADALFGKRSEVKDSHDRYANIEVSYLLQRMEAYRGLAILTTNMKSALDPAFLRRIRFVVEFPFPEREQRADIWRRTFPERTPVAELDIERLARLNIVGGSIRNIALGAAFLAADEGGAVRMSHLLRATRWEYSKLEKPLTDAETGGLS